MLLTLPGLLLTRNTEIVVISRATVGTCDLLHPTCSYSKEQNGQRSAVKCSLACLSLCPSSGYLTNPFHVSSLICCFLPPLSCVNPRFTCLILLLARPPTNLVGVPALTYWYCRLRLPAVTRGLKRPCEGSTSEWHDGWRQLRDDDSWKRFSDYWRKQNVETTRESPSITLAYEERGEENPEYRLPLVPETENKIIVRDCYKSLYDHILELRNCDAVGLVLTGQPGTGASSS
jgi:hypothetical protein